MDEIEQLVQMMKREQVQSFELGGLKVEFSPVAFVNYDDIEEPQDEEDLLTYSAD